MTTSQKELLQRLRSGQGVQVSLLGKSCCLRVYRDSHGEYFTGVMGNIIQWRHFHIFVEILSKRRADGTSPYLKEDEIIAIAESIISYNKVKAAGFPKEEVTPIIEFIKTNIDVSIGLEELIEDDLLRFCLGISDAVRQSGNVNFRGFNMYPTYIQTDNRNIITTSFSGFHGLCGGTTVSMNPSGLDYIKAKLGEEISVALMYSLINNIFIQQGTGLLLFSDVSNVRTISKFLDSFPVFKRVIKDVGIVEKNPKTNNMMRIYTLQKSEFFSKEFQGEIFSKKEKQVSVK